MRTLKLRYYQTECVKASRKYLQDGGKNGIAVLPTATGKSIIIAELIQELFKLNTSHRLMMVTHVKELIEQNFEKLKSVWEEHDRPPAGIYSAGLSRRDRTQPIIYAGIQSCYRRPKDFKKITYVLIDECHRISEKSTGMYSKFLTGLRVANPNLRVIGFTATPYRMGMGNLIEGPLFDKIFYDISRSDEFVKLIDSGYLCDLNAVKPKTMFNLNRVKVISGEFSLGSLDKNLNRDRITRKIVAETCVAADSRNKGLAFCISISHAENMARLFQEGGISSTCVHSKLTIHERDKRINGFKAGKYKVLTNVGVLTTGFDVPDIDFLVIARPTRSTSLHVQMLGRGMRVHKSKKDTLVLDYSGNILRLGLVNDPVLPHHNNEITDRIIVCKTCGTINQAAKTKCKKCGAVLLKGKATKKRQPIPKKNVYEGEVVKKTKFQTISFEKSGKNCFTLTVNDLNTNTVSNYTVYETELLKVGLQEDDVRNCEIVKITKKRYKGGNRRNPSKLKSVLTLMSRRHNRYIQFPGAWIGTVRCP